ILLDPPPPGSSTDPLVYRTAPGTTLDITGTIRNLSPKTWVNLGMRASVRLPTGSVEIPPILPANMINPSDPNTLGPFLVPPALGGDVQNDRIPFTMRLTVPATVLVGQTEVPLDGTFPIQFTLGQFRSGVLTPIRDENLGDHLARRTLRVQNVTSLVVDTSIVSNLNPAIGEDVVFQLRVVNTGTQPSSTTLIPQIRHVPEAGQTAEAPVILDPIDVALEAGQTSPYQSWTWTPTGPGIYAFEVQNNASYFATPPPPTFNRYIFVDRDLLFFSSDLEELSDDIPFLQDVQDPNVWSRQFRNTGRSCTNGAINSQGASGWQSNERAFSGSRSVLTAVTDEQYGGSSQNYGPLANDILYQPAADLRSLTDPGRSGSPSILDGVYLNMWYRAVTGAGDGLTVYARSVNQETLGFPTTRALTPLDTTNWRARNTACGNPAFTMNLVGTTSWLHATGYFGEPLPLLDGEQPSGDTWRPASFNLAAQSGLVGQWTQPLYVFGSDNDPDRRQGVFVDLISISGYDPRVDPPVQSFGLTDNATKEFQLRIENRAPVADRFTIAVDEDATSTNFIVDPVPGAIVDPTTVGFVHVEPSTLDLRAGETGTVTVRVDTRLDRELGSTGRLFIGLAVNSTGDPNRLALGRIEFPAFSPRLWPDLEAEIRVPATSTKAEGEPLNMLAAISNFGLAVNARSTYRILACPAETVQPLADCINDPARVIGSGVLPSIQPLQTTGRLDLSRLAVPLSWSPPLGSAGELRLVVVADPAGQVTDYDRSNNIHVFALTLTPHVEPDLSIVTEDLLVLNAAGDPVTSVLEGDLVSVRATVRNIGSAPAPSVRVRLINQFTLREDQVPSLDPGSSIEVAANWVAVPGTWVVKAEATTSRPETHLDNNVVAKKLVVRRNDFSLDATIPDLTGKPGDKWDVPLTLANKGDVATKVAFRFKAPPGIRAEVTPSPLQLPIGAELDATLRISADDQMKPGAYALVVEAFTSDGTRPPATLAVSISLQGQAGLRAPASLATTAATGNHTMAIPLVNTGTVVAVYQWAVVGPDGWRFSTAESSLQVLPGQTGQLQLDIDVPDDYAPGQYTVTVTLSGAGQTQVVPIHIVVAPRSVFETTVLRETIQPHAREILVRLENVGNIVGVPTFTLLADADGLRASIDPPLEALDPGHVSIHKVLLTNPSGATEASVVQVGSMILPSKAGPSSPSAKEAKIDLELQSLEATPDRSVRPGTPIKLDATVANKGNVELPPVPVALYVDGVLADQKMILIPAGAMEQVTFAWRASAGLHLLMVVVDPFDELPETNRANNLDSEVIETSGSRSFAAAFIPDLSLWAAVGAVALVALRSRRRNQA
ncbi:MAG TPA: CARDB domain-containing protein, partial [Candidatus Thermoplasmatota archaeon]